MTQLCSEQMHSFRTTVDNLRSLKILHDYGVDVSNFGNWKQDVSWGFEAGSDLFYKAVRTLFGNIEDISTDVHDVTVYYPFSVKCPQLVELRKVVSSSYFDKYFKIFDSCDCSYTSAEMLIKWSEQGFMIELHDYMYFYSEFIEHLIQFRETLDKQYILVMLQKGWCKH